MNFAPWFDRRIWNVAPGNFWEEMAELIKRPVHSGLRRLTVYPVRASHEMAHLLVCKDSEVFDPFWGIRVFTFDWHQPNRFDDDAAVVEIEVLVIDAILSGRAAPAEWAVLELQSYCDLQNCAYRNDREALLLDYARMFEKKWAVPGALWAERERKTALVLAQLYPGAETVTCDLPPYSHGFFQGYYTEPPVAP